MTRLVLVLTLLIAGCAAPGHLNTPSGRPELTVHAPMDLAQKACLHWFLANGFMVQNPGNTKEIIELSGNQFFHGGATNVWITYSFYPVNSTTTTIYAAKTIWYRFGGDTPQTSQEDYKELQNDLQAIAADIPNEGTAP